MFNRRRYRFHRLSFLLQYHIIGLIYALRRRRLYNRSLIHDDCLSQVLLRNRLVWIGVVTLSVILPLVLRKVWIRVVALPVILPRILLNVRLVWIRVVTTPVAPDLILLIGVVALPVSARLVLRKVWVRVVSLPVILPLIPLVQIRVIATPVSPALILLIWDWRVIAAVSNHALRRRFGIAPCCILVDNRAVKS